MRIMWLCNTLLPIAEKDLTSPFTKPESWISGIYEEIKNYNNIDLIYLYPSIEKKEGIQIQKVTFVGYIQKDIYKLEQDQITQFIELLRQYQPEIIHVFGTEFSHSYAMYKAAESLNMDKRVVYSIQGLVSIYSKHFFAYMSPEAILFPTVRDLLKRESLRKEKEKYEKRGKYELLTLMNATNVIGRTDWDKACTKRMNLNVKYYHCNETLRTSFYNNQWKYDNCEKHSLFLSQWYSPLKGLHIVLEAMGDLIDIYPDIKLYTTGECFYNGGAVEKLKYSRYKKYCYDIIKHFHLEENIVFLGFLSEQDMCSRLLKSNVFVSASSIENSPNSLGEAMILGVPCISSDVGGVKNLLDHGKEGFIYPADEPYMLAYYIRQLFEDKDLAYNFSKNAKIHARDTHDRKKNIKRLLQIYCDISGSTVL